MPTEDEIQAALLGLGQKAVRAGKKMALKSALSALDSVLADAGQGAKAVMQRVGHARGKIVGIIERIQVPDPDPQETPED
jgi:hypothetical protein